MSDLFIFFFELYTRQIRVLVNVINLSLRLRLITPYLDLDYSANSGYHKNLIQYLMIIRDNAVLCLEVATLDYLLRSLQVYKSTYLGVYKVM